MNFNDVPYRYPARSVTVDGFRMAYVDVNPEGGEPIVFLHDAGGDLDDFADVYGTLALGRRALGLDLIGFGKSDKPPLDEPLELFTRLLDGFLDAVDVTRASIVGHGTGALVAAMFALESPDRVDRLVLSAPPAIPALDAEARAVAAQRTAFDTVTSLDDEGRRAWYEAAAAGWNDRLDAYVATRHQLASSLAFRPWARALDAVTQASLAHDVLDRASGLTVPTLVIWGVDDPIAAFAGAASLRDAIPGARLVSIEECGHLPTLEQPEIFTDAIARFLAEVDETDATDGGAVGVAIDVEPWPGLTPGIGRIARLLFDERDRVTHLTAGLSIDDAAWRPSPDAASIGDLVLGTGARVARQLYEVLRGEVIPGEVTNQFRIVGDADAARIEAPKKSVGRLLADVASMHQWLAEWLSRRTDADLNRTFVSTRGGSPMTLRWVLWNLVEESLVDRGRIALMCETVGRSREAALESHVSGFVGWRV